MMAWRPSGYVLRGERSMTGSSCKATLLQLAGMGCLCGKIEGSQVRKKACTLSWLRTCLDLGPWWPIPLTPRQQRASFWMCLAELRKCLESFVWMLQLKLEPHATLESTFRMNGVIHTWQSNVHSYGLLSSVCNGKKMQRNKGILQIHCISFYIHCSIYSENAEQ